MPHKRLCVSALCQMFARDFAVHDNDNDEDDNGYSVRYNVNVDDAAFLLIECN